MTDECPACPGCQTDLLVEHYAGDADYLCYNCSRRFDTATTFVGRRGRPHGGRSR